MRVSEARLGRYDPADFVGRHKGWAHFIQPTITGESSGYFGRLNSYDRAAFTFGAGRAQAAPLSIAGSKAQLNAVLAGRVEQERECLDAMVLRADRSDDFREAARAFAEKRRPVFTGR